MPYPDIGAQRSTAGRVGTLDARINATTASLCPRRARSRSNPPGDMAASPDCSWPRLSRLLRPPRAPSPRRRPLLLAEPNHARILQARWHAKCLNVPVNATPAGSDCSWPRHSRSLRPSHDPPPRNRLSLLAKPDHARIPQARRHARCLEGTDHHDRSDL